MSYSHCEKVKYPRRRMEISVRFRLRPSQKDDLTPRPLLVRLTMDGKTISDYNSGVKVRPQKWSQENQMVIGRTRSTDEINERLSQIELQHREILRELKRRYMRGEGPRPTPELVKAEFIKPGSTSPTLLELYEKFLEHLDTLSGTEDEYAVKTITRAYTVRDHLKSFEAKSPQLADITTNWGKRFHVWLQIHPANGKRRMQKDTANKYLSHVRDALEYAIDEGFMHTNPLNKFRPKRGKGKPVYFMEQIHVERIAMLNYDDEQIGHILWWTQLMCYTALDYKDAIRYAGNRAYYEAETSAGKKVMITRSKPPQNVSEFPVLPQVEALFEIYPKGAPVIAPADVNRHLKIIGPNVGFKEKLSTKILRKTAGAIFLRLGYSIEAVSKFMGHSSIRTTEEYYVKVTSSYVDSEMQRINKAKSS